MIKTFLILLAVFIVGSLIVSWLVSGGFGGIGGFFEEILKPSLKSEDASVSQCLNQITEKASIEEKKSLFNTKIYPEEYKKFNNTNETIEFLREWGYEPSFFNFPDLFDGYGGNPIEHNDITIVLTRVKIYAPEGEIKLLLPLVCINGTLTENSKNKL